MPAGNRTGPLGQGPMTGRRMGICSGNGVPGYENRPAGVSGRGMGTGRVGGFARGFRRMFFATGLPGWLRFGSGAGPVSREEELAALKTEEEQLSKTAESVRNRIKDLESG